MSSKELYTRLLRYVLPHWRVGLLALFAMTVVAASEPAFPALLKPMLDGSFVQKDGAASRLIPLLLVGLFLVRGLAMYASSYATSWVAQQLVMSLRGEMFRKLLNLPARYFDNNTSGNLIAHVAFNVTQVTEAGTTVLTVLVRDSLTIIGLLAWMIYIDWKLTLIVLVMAPVIALIVTTVSRRLRTLGREAQRSLGYITNVLQESIEGYREVKIFGGQPYETQRFHDTINRARRFNMKYMMVSSASVSIVQFVAAVALAVIVYMASLQSAADKITVGGFISFFTAMLLLFPPLKRLTSINESFQRGLAAAEVIFELIDHPSEPDTGKQPLPKAKGEIVFADVSLDYDETEHPALSHINLAIHPGETVALVGQSGSGKTSLVNLLPRFYAPTSGAITLDGHDISDLKLDDLRENIAFVGQSVVLFNDTIAANIAYGTQRNASEAEIVAAAEAAHAMEFIVRMPNGLNTEIGENGVKLSGGQRQRLAIARAILKNAPILILDEATSALDTQSERHVQAALEALMKNRTTIVIAHRLSTIEKADRIVVMSQGEIAETGTHDELLKANGVYAHLHQIQFAADTSTQES